jgi:hypothetical protein
MFKHNLKINDDNNLGREGVYDITQLRDSANRKQERFEYNGRNLTSLVASSPCGIMPT